MRAAGAHPGGCRGAPRRLQGRTQEGVWCTQEAAGVHPGGCRGAPRRLQERTREAAGVHPGGCRGAPRRLQGRTQEGVVHPVACSSGCNKRAEGVHPHIEMSGRYTQLLG